MSNKNIPVILVFNLTTVFLGEVAPCDLDSVLYDILCKTLLFSGNWEVQD